MPAVRLYEERTANVLAQQIDQDETEQTTYKPIRSRGKRQREKRLGRQRDNNQEAVGDETRN